jgi:hypothetical protein
MARLAPQIGDTAARIAAAAESRRFPEQTASEDQGEGRA